jgi:cobalt-zinc-cadmium efflux system outer membrane protein
MKKLIYIILLSLISFAGFGQSFNSFMQSVENNNSRIFALQKWLEAEETKAKTGIYPDNPEINYNYLWGSPDAIGNQQELEITQSFKLPGYYTSKSEVQKLNFKQKQALAEKKKRETLHYARSAWFNLVWLHEKESLLKKRKEDAEKLVAIMREGFERGEISKPAFDKARIYAIGIQSEWRKVQSEIKVQTQYLEQLNGGNAIESLTFQYPLESELPDLDSLIAGLSENNPDLLIAQFGIQQSEQEVKHQRMNSLPSFKAGYKSETILDQKLQGFHAGISIPLWENKNRVKYAKLQTETSKANLIQQESEVKAHVSKLYYEIAALKENFEQMKLILEEERVSESRLELLQSGQISFSEYLVDIELIWDAQTQFLQNKNAYFELLSKLKTYR